MCHCIKTSRIRLIKPDKNSRSYAVELEYAAADLLALSSNSLHQTNVLFKENIGHLKLSGMLGALHAKARLSNELRQPLEKIQRFGQQMNALLEMKGKYGAGYIQAGYCSAQQAWKMKQKYRPPRYTACRNERLKIDGMRPVT